MTSDHLQEEIDGQRQHIRTDSYSMSINELVSLYESNEIEIHPEFQRFFRWDDSQKTKLIESILLGIPIPSIFVSQRETGEWDVVDGLQRLSTIYQFLGKLKDDKGCLVPPLILQKTKYLPSLENRKWEDSEEPSLSLTKTQQLLIKRAKLDITILQRESSPSTKYELFQRLNTGSSMCTPQEIRSCILVSINLDMYKWMKKLSENEDFNACLNLSEKLEEEQYDMEIISRFLVLKKLDADNISITDIAGFITDQIEKMAEDKSFNYEKETRAFETTFKVLSRDTKENTFRKYDPRTDKFSKGFLLAPFEVIATGIGYHYEKFADALSNNDEAKLDVKSKLKIMWEDGEYLKSYGRGKDAKVRIPNLVPFGRRLFDI